MIKKNFTFLLVLLLLNLIYCVDANTATQVYVPRNINIDRSVIPKNILVCSFVGGRSHLKPMLDVTAILGERGYNIILLTAGNYTPSSEYPTVKQISLGHPLKLANIGHSEEFDYKRLATSMRISFKFYKDTFEKYKSAAKDHNIDLFFCDALMNEACLDVAHALKKPVIKFTSFLNAIAPTTYKSDPIFRCGVSLENESFLERFRCTIIQPFQWMSLLRSSESQLNDIRKEIDVKPAPISMDGSSKVSLTLIDNFFGFELPQFLPPNVLEIGPVLPEEYPPLSPELSSFINGHERVVYVSFGTRVFSTIESNDKLLQAFIEAINKNIIDSVVWALVLTSKDSFSPILSLDDGTQIQTSPILNNEHPHIRFVKFAPQFSILNHTNTKLFFSHGGTGSCHESLHTGTPMLILPFFADQMGNAEKLQSAGVALTLDKFNVDVHDIVNKMDLILNDENVEKSVKRLEVLTKINSKRKYRAADLIEYILHSSGFNEGGVNEEFLKEWIPANTRMGFIRGNNYDVYGALLGITFGFIGGILWIILNLIRFTVKKISPSVGLKSKKE